VRFPIGWIARDSKEGVRGTKVYKRRLLATLGQEGVEKTSFDDTFSESSRRSSKNLPTVHTSIF